MRTAGTEERGIPRAAQPRAVSEVDDKELQDMMTKAEQETAQVAGDEPEDDEGM